MKYEMVLFDLDGTLLPMDQKEFVNGYFTFLCKKLAPFGYQPDELISAIWKGTGAMVKNTGNITNEEAFWECFSKVLGPRALEHKYLFEEFYANEFAKADVFCGFNKKSAETVSELKKQGYRVALATNPIFPAVATEIRIRWAGCKKEDFELYTTYENSHYCKPNPDYYREVCERLSIDPKKCLMVGNDAKEDGAASKAGMDVFLITDCLINEENIDISVFPNGSFDELVEYLK